MSRIYLWCRAWPWFRPEFPFEQFEELDDNALSSALEAHAHRWSEEHPGRLSEARNSAAQRRGMTPLLGPTRRPITSGDEPKPLTFEEIAVLAGWVDVRGPRIVVRSRGLSEFHPTPRVFFCALKGAGLAEEILEVLRKRVPVVPAGGHFGSGHAILRFGTVAESRLDKVERIRVARELEDFVERGTPTWALAVAQEAAKIERILRGNHPPKDGVEMDLDSQIKRGKTERGRKAQPAEQLAAASYWWAIKRWPDLAPTDGSGRNYAEIYKALVREAKESPYGGRRIPSAGTWKRQVRAGLEAEESA